MENLHLDFRATPIRVAFFYALLRASLVEIAPLAVRLGKPMNPHRIACLILFLLCLGSPSLWAQTQTPAAAQTVAPASVPLTIEQRYLYQEANTYFIARNFTAALETARKILPELKQGTVEYAFIARFASDASINAGNYDFALATLRPMEASDPGDWRTAGMLARVYAETGKRELRDQEVARIFDLHQHAKTQELANQQQFYLERISVAGGTVRVSIFLEPYGKFHTEMYAWVCDEAGHELLRIALENSDIDQKFFAKEHPDQVKQGIRRYSLDGYEEVRMAGGIVNNNHITYGFYDGKPSYDLLRARMIEIGTSKLKSVSAATK
jgi:tetratricopeptide (TPR) repeat protein